MGRFLPRLGHSQGTGEAVEERRLARAVGTDQPDDLALGHLEGDSVEGHDAPEANGEVVDGDERRAAGGQGGPGARRRDAAHRAVHGVGIRGVSIASGVLAERGRPGA